MRLVKIVEDTAVEYELSDEQIASLIKLERLEGLEQLSSLPSANCYDLFEGDEEEWDNFQNAKDTSDYILDMEESLIEEEKAENWKTFQTEMASRLDVDISR